MGTDLLDVPVFFHFFVGGEGTEGELASTPVESPCLDWAEGGGQQWWELKPHLLLDVEPGDLSVGVELEVGRERICSGEARNASGSMPDGLWEGFEPRRRVSTQGGGSYPTCWQ